ncbi:MAG: flippase-like domain-containing protein [Thermodesulfobacteriota bacterium]|nr:flippase-like domain-containing protein [Thermodesulfobacteriota bacterium]
MAIDFTKYLKNRSRLWFTLFSVCVTVGFFFYLFSTVSLGEIAGAIRGVSVGYVIVFVFFSFIMSLCRTWRYSLIIEASGYQTATVALFLVTLVRNFFSDLLPARLGTLVYIYLVQNRLGLPFGAAAASFGLSFIFDILSLAFLILLAAIMISVNLISPLIIFLGGFILLAVSGSILFYLPALLNISASICLKFLPMGRNFRQKIHDALIDTRRDVVKGREQGIFLKVFFLSLGVRCYKYLALYALLLALVIPLGFTVQSFPLPKVFLGLCSAEMAASLPISGIAGFGAYEGAWTLVFRLLGYSEQIALLTSVSHHLITQVYGYSLGVIALLILLLPYFRDSCTPVFENNVMSRRRVWLQIAGSALLLIASLYLLFPGEGDAQAGKGAGRTGAHEEMAAESAATANVSGKFVYEWKGGIYIGKIGISDTRRIAALGTYPRWSPDGRFIAYVENNRIMLVAEQGGTAVVLTTADRARALCFSPDGRSVFFTEGTRLRNVTIRDHTVTTLLDGYELLEIDARGIPVRLAATVRKRFGYEVYAFDLKQRKSRAVAKGCSASLSPDGGLITVNGKDHRLLHLYDWSSLQPAGRIHAPAGHKFDNQFWSNNSDWLISVSEQSGNLFIHQVSEDRSFGVTRTGGCDRPDLFITPARQ